MAKVKVLTKKYAVLRTEPINKSETDKEKKEREKEQHAVESDVEDILESFDVVDQDGIDGNPVVDGRVGVCVVYGVRPASAGG